MYHYFFFTRLGFSQIKVLVDRRNRLMFEGCQLVGIICFEFTNYQLANYYVGIKTENIYCKHLMAFIYFISCEIG